MEPLFLPPQWLAPQWLSALVSEEVFSSPGLGESSGILALVWQRWLGVSLVQGRISRLQAVPVLIGSLTLVKGHFV